jgi:capsular exopolysaccharide synthesis family protein
MQSVIFNGQQPQENLLRSLFTKYFFHWRLFVVLLALFGIGALIYIKFKVPVYKLQASIIINDEQKGLDDSKLVESLNLFNAKKIVENEIEVIKSQSLAEKIVRKLSLYAPINEKGTFTTHSAYNTSPVQIIAKYPDSIKSAKEVDFVFDNNKQQVLVNKDIYNLNQWINSSYGIIKYIANPNYQLSQIPKRLHFSLLPVANAARDLLEGLEVTSSNKLSTVVTISLKDEIPERGKSILNELITIYDLTSIEEKNALARNTLSFVEDRLQKVVHDLDSIESGLQLYKAQNNIVDINTQGQLFLKNVGENDQKIGDINMQLAVLGQLENYVSGKEDRGGIVPSTLGINDPVLSNLLDKLYSTELEYEKVRKIAPENNPILLSLTDQINKIKPNILENIKSRRQGLMAGKIDLSATNNKYSSMLSTLPKKERQLLEINRQQAIKNNVYNFLLQKREEAAFSYASSISNSRVVDSAFASKKPVSPNKLLVCMIAIIGALGSGIGYISVKDLLNSNIASRAEIESFTQMPILGELVKNNSKNTIVVDDNNPTFIAEQFRHLRTLLTYSGISNSKKKILVTSTISTEGKSFVAVNLGMTLALANKKVVLVDLDLRRPTLGALLNVLQLEGISQYLKGEKEIESIIKRSGRNPNLFVIPSGPIVNNPSELLLSDKILALFSHLEGLFDYIIIDTPPVNPVTDACIVSPLCDATLYVIRQGVTPRMFVQKLDNFTRTNSLNNIAIVFNGVNGKGVEKYGYKYGYTYIEEKKRLKKV